MKDRNKENICRTKSVTTNWTTRCASTFDKYDKWNNLKQILFKTYRTRARAIYVHITILYKYAKIFNAKSFDLSVK